MTAAADITPASAPIFRWLALLTLATACAMPTPPSARVNPAEESDHARTLPWRPLVEIIEGQPRGALLALRLPEGAPEEITEVVLLRQIIDPAQGIRTEFQVHYSFTPADQSPIWSGGAARFLDEGLNPGVQYRYAAAAQGDATTLSAIASLTWERPPTAPENVKAESVGAHTVISWSSSPRCGAAVFRRAIGSRRYVRLAPMVGAGEDVFLDTEAAPGKLYSYRVSAIHFTESGTPLLGQPSQEVFVRIMDEPPTDEPPER